MEESKNDPQMTELDWIELNEEIDSFKNYETFWEKAKRRTLANPIAPIGLLAACGFLGFGLRELQRGNSKNQQFMMRGRVISQAIGIGSIMLSVMLMQRK